MSNIAIFMMLFISMVSAGLSGCTEIRVNQPNSNYTPILKASDAGWNSSVESINSHNQVGSTTTPEFRSRTLTPETSLSPVIPKFLTPTLVFNGKLLTTTRTISSICNELKGNIVFGEVPTKLLTSPLSYRVYLPPCYEQEAALSFPVLYLIHGQSFTDDQWDRIGADETADQMIKSGEIPPLIIVMPYDRSGGLQPTESNFGKAMAHDLVLMIDKNFRTKRDREFRAVGGLSRGGGWSIHLGMVYWRFFGKVGGHSPAVFYSDAEQMRSFIDKISRGFLSRNIS